MQNPTIAYRHAFLVLVTWLVSNYAIAAPGDSGEKPINIGREPQLFLDDWIVERRTGLERVLHSPQKYGVIQNADGTPWERGGIYLGNIVHRDSTGRFHMTYRFMWDDPSVRDLHPSIGEDKAHWFRETVAYATSQDGIHWEKPNLGLTEGPAAYRSDGPFRVATRLSKENNRGVPFDFIYDLHAHGNLGDPRQQFLLRVTRKEDTHPFARVLESQLYFAAAWPDFVSDPQFMMPTISNVWRKGTTELRLVLSRDAGQTWQRLGSQQVWLCRSPE